VSALTCQWPTSAIRQRPAAAGTAVSPGLESALVITQAQLNLLGWLRLAIIGT
jgi:hypothetical protein